MGTTARFYRAALMIPVAALLFQGCGTRVASEHTGAPSGPADAAAPPAGSASHRPAEARPRAAAAAPPGTPLDDPVGGPPPGAAPTSARTRSDAANLLPRPQESQPTPASAEPAPAGPPSLPSGPTRGPESGPHSAILMANVGTYSGPVGSFYEPMVKAAQLWVRTANAKGGVAGHQIKLTVYDDGGDPARHRAHVRDAVENRGVIGFLMNADGFAGASSVGYINARRVPVVGSDPGGEWKYSSPMYFLQGATGDEHSRTFTFAVAQQVLPQGKKRFGTLTCVEAEGCARGAEIAAKTAREAGLNVVYQGRASIAQPDFTAECLSARKENVEVLALGLDQNSVARLTAACARQGFHPIYAPVAADDRQKDNPELAGAVGASTVFPYFQSGTPATDEFQAAVGGSGGGIALGPSTALGWAAGKMLERAAGAISEPPTAESLLAGLWSIKTDPLGGLTPPLTFLKDKPPGRINCWFNHTVAQGAWVSPDGFRLNCR